MRIANKRRAESMWQLTATLGAVIGKEEGAAMSIPDKRRYAGFCRALLAL